MPANLTGQVRDDHHSTTTTMSQGSEIKATKGQMNEVVVFTFPLSEANNERKITEELWFEANKKRRQADRAWDKATRYERKAKLAWECFSSMKSIYEQKSIDLKKKNKNDINKINISSGKKRAYNCCKDHDRERKKKVDSP